MYNHYGNYARKVKIEIQPLSRDYRNFKSWKDSVVRYLQKEDAKHLVHRIWNKEVKTDNNLDKKRPIHTIILAKKQKQKTPASPLEEMAAELMPEIPEQKHMDTEDEEFDEVEHRFLENIIIYAKPDGKPESAEEEKKRYKVWDEITKSLCKCQHLVEEIPEGNIHKMLQRACHAYKPNLMEHLEAMERLAQLRKSTYMTIAELQGKYHT